MKPVLGCTFLVVALVAALLVMRPSDMVYVRSSLTGKEYAVKKAPDAQAMADRLAELEHRLRRLLDGSAALTPGDTRLNTIRRQWDGTLSEVQVAGEVAFSVDKSSISVCLRDSQGRIEDLNTSMFVLLHELAHVATADYGHSRQFWDNMQFLLEVAEALGLYVYENYDAAATTFCGHPVGASPLTCVKTGGCKSQLTARV